MEPVPNNVWFKEQLFKTAKKHTKTSPRRKKSQEEDLVTLKELAAAAFTTAGGHRADATILKKPGVYHVLHLFPQPRSGPFLGLPAPMHRSGGHLRQLSSKRAPSGPNTYPQSRFTGGVKAGCRGLLPCSSLIYLVYLGWKPFRVPSSSPEHLVPPGPWCVRVPGLPCGHDSPGVRRHEG